MFTLLINLNSSINNGFDSLIIINKTHINYTE